MKPALLAIGAACLVGVSTTTGIAIGISAGIGACSGGAGTSVTTPSTPAPAPSSPSTPNPSDPRLAVAAQYQQASPTDPTEANAKTVWDYFKTRGLDDIHDAAIMGSFEQESSFDPERIESGGESTDPNASGSAGWGVAQWTPGSRVITIAADYGITGPIYELDTQLNIVWNEMTIGPTPTSMFNFNSQFLAQTTLEGATQFFTEGFEGPGVVGDRLRYAEQALQKYAGSAVTTASSNVCSSSGAAAPLASNVYQVGDSITVGMDQEGALKAKYAAKGITVTQVEASDGNSIAAAQAKLNADAGTIKAADTAVVELGTYDYTSGEQADEQAIDSFVHTLQSINPSIRIYWMNAYSWHDLIDVSNINGAIANQAGTDGYTVIDWNKEAQQNRSKYMFDRQAGVQQTKAAGYGNMAQFLASQFSSTPITAQDAPSYCKTGTAVGAEKLVCSAWLFDDYGYNWGGDRGNAQFLKGFLADVKTCVTGNFGAGCKYPKGTLLVDCSGLVDAALYDAYGIDVDGATTGDYPGIPEFREIPFSEAAAGDIVWKSDHTEIVTGNDPSTQTLTTFGAHQNYADVTRDISPDTYNYSYFTKVYRVVLPGQYSST